jgi:small subunit ribosomal protein S17e
MGNIRPKYIKRIAIELLEKFPNEFNEDFQFNKNNVGKLTDVSTKIMRNRIAGYVTRYYIKMQKHAL